MKRSRKFLIIGTWVIILPYLGIPIAFKNILLVLSGLVIIYQAYRMYLESKKDAKEEKTFDNFSENKDFAKTEPSN